MAYLSASEREGDAHYSYIANKRLPSKVPHRKWGVSDCCSGCGSPSFSRFGLFIFISPQFPLSPHNKFRILLWQFFLWYINNYLFVNYFFCNFHIFVIFLWKFSCFFFPSFLIFFFNLLIFPSQRICPDLLVFSLLIDSSGFCIITLVFYWLPIISCVSNVLALTVKYWGYICWFLSHQEYFKFTSVSALWIMQVQVDGLLFQSIQVKELSSIQHISTHFACSLFDIVWYSCWLSSSFYS